MDDVVLSAERGTSIIFSKISKSLRVFVEQSSLSNDDAPGWGWRPDGADFGLVSPTCGRSTPMFPH